MDFSPAELAPNFSGFLNVKECCSFALWRPRRCQWEDWGPALLWWSLGLSERSWLPLLSRSSKLFLSFYLTGICLQQGGCFYLNAKIKWNSWKMYQKKVIKNGGVCPRKYIRGSHEMITSFNTKAQLLCRSDLQQPKYCHGEGSQVSSRAVGLSTLSAQSYSWWDSCQTLLGHSKGFNWHLQKQKLSGLSTFGELPYCLHQ